MQPCNQVCIRCLSCGCSGFHFLQIENKKVCIGKTYVFRLKSSVRKAKYRVKGPILASASTNPVVYDQLKCHALQPKNYGKAWD